MVKICTQLPWWFKTLAFGAAHIYMAYLREYPPLELCIPACASRRNKSECKWFIALALMLIDQLKWYITNSEGNKISNELYIETPIAVCSFFDRGIAYYEGNDRSAWILVIFVLYWDSVTIWTSLLDDQETKQRKRNELLKSEWHTYRYSDSKRLNPKHSE